MLSFRLSVSLFTFSELCSQVYVSVGLGVSVGVWLAGLLSSYSLAGLFMLELALADGLFRLISMFTRNPSRCDLSS